MTLFNQTAADTLSSVSDATARQAVHSRILADALAGVGVGFLDTEEGFVLLTESGDRLMLDQSSVGVGDAVASQIAYTRTEADAIAALVDVAASAAAHARQVVDTLSNTATGAVARTAARARTVADAASSVTDSVTRIAARQRTIADTAASVTDSPPLRRIARLLSDVLAAITDSVAIFVPSASTPQTETLVTLFPAATATVETVNPYSASVTTLVHDDASAALVEPPRAEVEVLA